MKNKDEESFLGPHRMVRKIRKTNQLYIDGSIY